jgi:lipoprotein-releasing system permease protein
MNVPRLIAWRYLRRPTDKLVSAVGIVSIFGLVIGVMALVISMALMTGYRGDLQQKLLGGNAEVFVYSVGGPIADTTQLLHTLRTTTDVLEASPVLFQHALATTESSSTGSEVMLKGIEPGRGKVTPMIGKIVGSGGRFETAEGERGVTVGKYLARKLGVTKGSSISVTVPTDHGGSFLPRTASFVVTNVFDTGFYEYDARWLFIDLRAAEQLVDAAGSANLVEIKLTPGASIDAVVKNIEQRTMHHYAVSDWRDMNRQLFSMLKIQQLVLFIVIGLIVFVSTFNIVSTLIMTVHEKRKEIGILASMGADRKFVGRVFLWYGTLVGFAGTATGVILGVAVCWTITRYHLVSFPPEIAEVYFVSSIPFVTRIVDVSVIAAFSLIVSFLATIVPSSRASRLSPVEGLRH